MKMFLLKIVALIKVYLKQPSEDKISQDTTNTLQRANSLHIMRISNISPTFWNKLLNGTISELTNNKNDSDLAKGWIYVQSQ